MRKRYDTALAHVLAGNRRRLLKRRRYRSTRISECRSGAITGMMGKSSAYTPKQGGAVVEDAVCGFEIVVHHPANTAELEKRVAQAHADAIIAKVKKLNCSAQQKKELIDAICG